MRRPLSFFPLGLAFSAFLFSGCGYNRFQQLDEEVKAQWSEVLNQYQRRADLIPNLVQVVKGYAVHEEKVLIEVAEARARIGSIQATPALVNDEAAMAKFMAAQNQMTGALSRLMAVSENYPNLKADGMFRDLQAQIEGTENRNTVARGRYIETIKEYNVLARSFPSNLTAMMFHYPIKANFSVQNEEAISKPPSVDFSQPPAHPPAEK